MLLAVTGGILLALIVLASLRTLWRLALVLIVLAGIGHLVGG
jgi:hypothetical protein